ADLSLTLAPLDQVFQSDLATYTASSGFAGSSTQVIATTVDENATITVDGIAAPNGAPGQVVSLAVGSNDIEVVSTAEDGTPTTYTVEITRADAVTFAQRAYVKASNTNADDRFSRVAVDRDTLVVGAPGEASAATGIDGDELDNTLFEAGAVYVFTRAAGVWTQQAYIKASNTDSGDRFGAYLDIDGDTLIVGAPGEKSLASGIGGDQSNNSGSDVGAVYVFVRDLDGTWSQHSYIKASTVQIGDAFARVAIDGDRLVVGAVGENSGATGVDGDQNDTSQLDSGAAYVFDRDDTGVWSQVAYLKASNTTAGDAFGRVSVSGATVAIGAIGEDSKATGADGDQADNSEVDSGAVYVFDRAVDGTWSQTAYLKSSNTDTLDAFGNLALFNDILVVSAIGEDSVATGIDGDQADNSAVDSGAVYGFFRSDAGWNQEVYIKASNADASDGFGLGISSWGTAVAVGAFSEQSSATGVNLDQSDNTLSAAGAAYVFERSGLGVWSQLLYIKASNANGDDRFGEFVALGQDTFAAGAQGENSIAVGVNNDETNESATAAGAVYIFD
ncbi:MAG: cadherin-like beta sandwich domain-containing protein, partial [Gammaproteobacteria bacterium]|nr:cadherin-like beta sandwich domain-containing protein [Gammaproteobacteria bacterium]